MFGRVRGVRRREEGKKGDGKELGEGGGGGG